MLTSAPPYTIEHYYAYCKMALNLLKEDIARKRKAIAEKKQEKVPNAGYVYKSELLSA